MDVSYGFIGLGAMGYEMAMNIRIKSPPEFSLVIFDVKSEIMNEFMQAFSSHGKIEFAASPREVAEKASCIVSIVPTAEHVKDVYLNSTTGIIAASKNDQRLLVECSTIDVDSTKEVESLLRQAGAGSYVDAPVSGGVPGARDATLSFLIGAPSDTSDDADYVFGRRLHELLAKMGEPRKFFYCGNVGTGLAAKICNNYLSGVNLLAAAEVMNIGIRHGIDRKLLFNVIHNSTGQSFMFDNVNPAPGTVANAPSSRDYIGGFKAQMMVKDMTLGVDAGALVGIRTTTASAALALYKEAAIDPRCIDRDVSVVYRFLGGTD